MDQDGTVYNQFSSDGSTINYELSESYTANTYYSKVFENCALFFNLKLYNANTSVDATAKVLITGVY